MTVVNMIVCDFCGKEGTALDQIQWFELATPRPAHLEKRHFCSLECLYDYVCLRYVRPFMVDDRAAEVVAERREGYRLRHPAPLPRPTPTRARLMGSASLNEPEQPRG